MVPRPGEIGKKATPSIHSSVHDCHDRSVWHDTEVFEYSHSSCFSSGKNLKLQLAIFPELEGVAAHLVNHRPFTISGSDFFFRLCNFLPSAGSLEKKNLMKILHHWVGKAQ